MSIFDLQQNLKASGYDCGVPDGSIGPKTLQAMAEFLMRGKAPDDVGVHLAKWMPIGEITTRPRIIPFMGHVAVESGFAPKAENMNYSVQGLIDTFGRHRISVDDAKRLGRYDNHPADQKAIANLVYGGDWGLKNLGNLAPGDGWKHRGAGGIQLTGLAGQRAVGVLVGMDFANHPELLLTPEGSIAGAVGFWMWKNLNATVDKPGDQTALETIKINGGANGLSERYEFKKRLRDIWPA